MVSLRERLAAGMPTLATCAGLILLSREVLDGRPDQLALGVLDVSVRRNGYGRQVESFEADLSVAPLGVAPFRAVFIRAPLIESVGPDVEVIASFDENPVAIALRRAHGGLSWPLPTRFPRASRQKSSRASPPPAIQRGRSTTREVTRTVSDRSSRSSPILELKSSSELSLARAAGTLCGRHLQSGRRHSQAPPSNSPPSTGRKLRLSRSWNVDLAVVASCFERVSWQDSSQRH